MRFPHSNAYTNVAAAAGGGGGGGGFMCKYAEVCRGCHECGIRYNV